MHENKWFHSKLKIQNIKIVTDFYNLPCISILLLNSLMLTLNDPAWVCMDFDQDSSPHPLFLGASQWLPKTFEHSLAKTFSNIFHLQQNQKKIATYLIHKLLQSFKNTQMLIIITFFFCVLMWIQFKLELSMMPYFANFM